MTLLIAFFALAIFTSFLCSLWEAVLLSITPSYANRKAREGTVTGKRLVRFKKDIDKPLAAILTLNTIAHTVGAIGVGNQAAIIWADANPMITNLIIPAGMTLGILILSEIIPKTLGASYWKEFAPFTTTCLSGMVYALAPLLWMVQGITRMFKKKASGSIFSRSDFIAMAEMGVDHGVFGSTESTIIQSLVRFDQVQAKDIMTPRTVIRSAPAEMTLAEFAEKHATIEVSRIPIYKNEDREQITGYVLKSDILAGVLAGQGEHALASIRRDLVSITGQFPITDLFTRFIDKREHIALVVDEFGGVGGLVTMEDVIETLLGLEIVDESDNTRDMQELARRYWEKRARAMGLLQPGTETTEVPAEQPSAP